MALDWTALGSAQYRQWELYESLPWRDEVDDVSDFHIAGAPYGGPIAMVRDESRLVAVQGDRSIANSLVIYTAAGRRLAAVPWQDKPLLQMGWTDSETLVCVLSDGRGLMYDLHGTFNLEFRLLKPTSEETVVRCVIWGDGLVALCSDLTLLHMSDLHTNEPKIHKLCEQRSLTLTSLSRERLPTAMAVLEAQFSQRDKVEVLLGTPDNSVLIATDSHAEDQEVQGKLAAPITMMAVAPNGRFLACFTADGFLTVLTTSFTQKVLTFDTTAATNPMQMLWCGEDSIILHWTNLGLLMVGPYSDCAKFPYEGALHMVQEKDCCRIYSADVCEMMQKVPQATEQITAIGSTSPAAMLYDAQEAFRAGDAKADENTRSILTEGKLEQAVTQCIAAARHEFDKEWQQTFLKAAAYGQCFDDEREIDRDAFVDACKDLRVLNAVRDESVGVPLTAKQYELLTPEVLVHRLAARRHHLLASKICDYLKIRKDGVLVHWAQEKIKSSPLDQVTDAELLQMIRWRLEPVRGISYEEITLAAKKADRPRLASMMLDFEPQAADQVRLLLLLQEREAALQKAVVRCVRARYGRRCAALLSALLRWRWPLQAL
jgi:hypothetical protein